MFLAFVDISFKLIFHMDFHNTPLHIADIFTWIWINSFKLKTTAMNTFNKYNVGTKEDKFIIYMLSALYSVLHSW